MSKLCKWQLWKSPTIEGCHITSVIELWNDTLRVGL